MKQPLLVGFAVLTVLTLFVGVASATNVSCPAPAGVSCGGVIYQDTGTQCVLAATLQWCGNMALVWDNYYTCAGSCQTLFGVDDFETHQQCLALCADVFYRGCDDANRAHQTFDCGPWDSDPIN